MLEGGARRAKAAAVGLAPLLLLQSPGASALENGLGRTPAMGFNAWNRFRCNVSEDVIRSTALAIKEKGLLEAGYKYINLHLDSRRPDDCWSTRTRNGQGRLEEDRERFPSGMKALGEWLRSEGFLFGIYSSAGEVTCEQYPGSLGHEQEDAWSFAEWGVDYLKYDNCGYWDNRTPPELKFPAMTRALEKAGRTMLFSICEWGVNNPAAWAGDLGNSWRTTPDIEDRWESMLANLDANGRRWRQAGPGHFNDADMLEVGNGGMTVEEYRSHMSLWSAMKTPLLIGCDVRSVSHEILDILGNKDVIAINQDKLGAQARRVWSSKAAETPAYTIATQCGNEMGWHWRGTQLVHLDGRCLTRGYGTVQLEPCDGKSDMQTWELTDDGLLRPIGFPQWAVEVYDEDNHKPSPYGAINEGVLVQISDVKPGAINQKWTMTTDTPTPRLINQWQQQCLTAETDAPPGDQEVWAGPLMDGGAVAILFNRGEEAATIRADWKMLGLVQGRVYEVRDLWTKANTRMSAEGDGSLEAHVPAHGVAMYRLRHRQCPFVMGVYARGMGDGVECSKLRI